MNLCVLVIMAVCIYAILNGLFAVDRHSHYMDGSGFYAISVPSDSNT